MAIMYNECFKNKNIIYAAKHIWPNKLITSKQLKQVKQILRRCNLNIGNVVDNKLVLNEQTKVAMITIYNQIQPIFEQNISKDCYSNKVNITEKLPISKICSKVTNSKHIFIIQLNFNEYFQNISKDVFINTALDNLRTLGVTDNNLLRTIKFLAYLIVNKNNRLMDLLDTLLGKLLIDCFLNKIDIWINNNIDCPSKNFTTDFARHKNDYLVWLKSRKRQAAAKYYRYSDQLIFLINTRVEQIDICNKINQFLISNNIHLKIKTGYDKFDFLGYRIIKRYEHNQSKIGITPSNSKEVYRIIKNTKWNSVQDISLSLSNIIKLFNKYDICNNMKFYLNALGLRLLKIARRRTTLLQPVKGHVLYTYTMNNKQFKIDIYELRRLMRVSFKEYLLHPVLMQKDLISVPTIYFHGHILYRWALWIKQLGKDGITKKILNLNNMHIHHINGDHFDNRFNNLILISKQVHYLLHSNISTNDEQILLFRKKIVDGTPYAVKVACTV